MITTQNHNLIIPNSSFLSVQSRSDKKSYFELPKKITIFVKKFMVRKKHTSIDEALEQSVYINPLTDFGFKRLFGKKEASMSFQFRNLSSG